MRASSSRMGRALGLLGVLMAVEADRAYTRDQAPVPRRRVYGRVRREGEGEGGERKGAEGDSGVRGGVGWE